MPSISKRFLEKLENLDRSLGAIYDPQEDSIFVHAVRDGLKVHELTVKRKFAENYEELENRTLIKLNTSDVWTKFGTGDKYDDWLWEEEEKARLKKKKEVRSERMAWFKDNRELIKAAIWNAQSGRMTAKTALPYQTSSVSMMAVGTENKGFKVIDKRIRTTEPITGLKDQGE